MNTNPGELSSSDHLHLMYRQTTHRSHSGSLSSTQSSTQSSTTKLQLQTMLPPMGDVWLDNDDDDEEDDYDEEHNELYKSRSSSGNNSELMKRLKWHSRKESTDSGSAATTNVNSPVSSTVSVNMPQLTSKSSSLSLVGLKKFGSRSASTGANVGTTTSEGASHVTTGMASQASFTGLTAKSSSNRLRKLFGTSQQQPGFGIDKSLISSPSNFVHTAHLDPSALGVRSSEQPPKIPELDDQETTDLKIVSTAAPDHVRQLSSSTYASASTSRSYQSHRKTSTSGSSSFGHRSRFNSGSFSSATSHLRDNSSASTMSTSTPATSIRTSPPASFVAQFPHSTSSNTVKNDYQSDFKNDYENHYNGHIQHETQQRGPGVVAAKTSVESFTSWATPNPEFVEQQKWLLNNVLGSDHSIHAFVNGDHSPTQFSQAFGSATAPNKNESSYGPMYSVSNESGLLPASASYNSMLSSATISTAKSNSNLMGLAAGADRKSVLLP